MRYTYHHYADTISKWLCHPTSIFEVVGSCIKGSRGSRCFHTLPNDDRSTSCISEPMPLHKAQDEIRKLLKLLNNRTCLSCDVALYFLGPRTCDKQIGRLYRQPPSGHGKITLLQLVGTLTQDLFATLNPLACLTVTNRAVGRTYWAEMVCHGLRHDINYYIFRLPSYPCCSH